MISLVTVVGGCWNFWYNKITNKDLDIILGTILYEFLPQIYWQYDYTYWDNAIEYLKFTWPLTPGIYDYYAQIF